MSIHHNDAGQTYTVFILGAEDGLYSRMLKAMPIFM